MSAAPAARSSGQQMIRVLAGLGIILVGLNLRPAVTSLGTLLDQIQRDVPLSSLTAGVVTTLPVLAFATVGATVPTMVKRLGLVASVLCADIILAAGLLLRAVMADAAWSLLLWTAIATAGIAVANVLLPSIAQAFFPRRLGTATGVYTMALQVGSASAAGLTVPLAQLLGGWQRGLGIWAILAIIAAPPWLIVLFLANRTRQRSAAPQKAASDQATPNLSQKPARLKLERSGLAWALTVFFGMQALGAYVIMGWLPQIYRDAGLSSATAGALLAVVMGIAAPMALILPVAAHRMADQRGLVIVVTSSMAIGYTGLAVAPAAGAWLWAFLLGVGSGAFPLALGLIGLRARSNSATTALSAFSQSAGYILALGGPFAVGALYQWAGTWTVPIGLLLALLVPQLIGGLIAGQNRYVDD